MQTNMPKQSDYMEHIEMNVSLMLNCKGNPATILDCCDRIEWAIQELKGYALEHIN